MSRRRGGARFVGVLVVITVLTLGTAADAHVVGRMELTGSSGGTSVGLGGYGPAAGQCSFADGYPTGAARAASTGGSITIAVSRNEDLLRHNWCRQFGAGENTVRLWPGAHFVPDAQGRWVSPGTWGEYPGQCRYEGIIIGTMNVDHRGNGSGTFSLPAGLVPNGTDEAAAVCVYSTTDTARANFAPLVVVP